MSRYDEAHERMERERDIMRGLGQSPSLGDMRAWGERLNYAALADGEMVEMDYAETFCPHCGADSDECECDRASAIQRGIDEAETDVEDTWQCHVCGDVRPDSRISVFKREERVGAHGARFAVNVRYCNDREKCEEGAPHVARRWMPGSDS